MNINKSPITMPKVTIIKTYNITWGGDNINSSFGFRFQAV